MDRGPDAFIVHGVELLCFFALLEFARGRMPRSFISVLLIAVLLCVYTTPVIALIACVTAADHQMWYRSMDLAVCSAIVIGALITDYMAIDKFKQYLMTHDHEKRGVVGEHDKKMGTKATCYFHLVNITLVVLNGGSVVVAMIMMHERDHAYKRTPPSPGLSSYSSVSSCNADCDSIVCHSVRWIALFYSALWWVFIMAYIWYTWILPDRHSSLLRPQSPSSCRSPVPYSNCVPSSPSPFPAQSRARSRARVRPLSSSMPAPLLSSSSFAPCPPTRSMWTTSLRMRLKVFGLMLSVGT